MNTRTERRPSRVFLMAACLASIGLPLAGIRSTGEGRAIVEAGGGHWRMDLRSAAALQPTSRPDDGRGLQDEGETGREPGSPGLRRLTPEEINRIRFLELRGMRLGAESSPDRVTVKISSRTVDEFLALMEGTPNFRGEEARREFRRLTPAQKLHLMAAEKQVDFAKKVEIRSDPEVFVVFRKQVLPIVLQSCATSGCHTASAGVQVKFGLFKDPKKLPETTYADFIMLNDLEVGGRKLLNRSQPGESLLLTYMLPAKDVKLPLRHPGTRELKPVYQDRAMNGFKKIEKWIASLKHPSEDYGVHLLQPGPSTVPEDHDEVSRDP